MNGLIECIPNISDGRHQGVLADCAAAIRRSGAALLDTHTDPDHNRSVFSFAGSVARVEAAALALVEVATARIDLREHRGVHPRMGAVDVMPFVPLGNTTLDACADLARRVGEQVAARFALPVLLYEAAARTPDRRHLEAVRRGGFEGLGTHLATSAWTPDFGPTRPHPTAGAIAIGARRTLVAFNVNLKTNDLAVAQAIAHAIRARDGGLPAVKALGLPLESRGLVQVSMNLVDFAVTPPVVAFDHIVAEATRYGVTVLESELVGLAPAAALPDDPIGRLMLPPGREYVLEHALRKAGLLTIS